MVTSSVVLLAGAGAVFATAGSTALGAAEAVVGAILGWPLSWVGQGLKKIRVPAEKIPIVTTVVGGLIMKGVSHVIGADPETERALVRMGAQGGLAAPAFHDNGWMQSPRKAVEDVSSAVIPGVGGKKR